MNKKYLLFAGDDFYPEGGGWDFKGSYETIEEAVEAHDPNKYEYYGGWANILDLNTEKVVKAFRGGNWN